MGDPRTGVGEDGGGGTFGRLPLFHTATHQELLGQQQVTTELKGKRELGWGGGGGISGKHDTTLSGMKIS